MEAGWVCVGGKNTFVSQLRERPVEVLMVCETKSQRMISDLNTIFRNPIIPFSPTRTPIIQLGFLFPMSWLG